MEWDKRLTPWYVLETANVAGGGEKHQRPREVGTVPPISLPFVASFAVSSQNSLRDDLGSGARQRRESGG